MASSVKKITVISKFYKHHHLRFNRQEKIYFLQTLAEMLKQGFSIHQSLIFIKILLPKKSQTIDLISSGLSKGQPIEQLLLHYGYSSHIAAQLLFAQKQGRFNQALFEVVKQLKTINTYQKKLIKTLSYPCFLFILLTALLFGMRHWMLPHILSFINKSVLETYPLAHYLLLIFTFFPQICLTFVAGCLFTYLLIDFYLMRLPITKRFQIYAKLPLIGNLCRKYASYRFAEEMGYFYKGGFSMQQILDFLIQHPIDPFLSELGNYLHHQFLKGIDLADSLKAIDIFTDSLGLVIYQGELTSQTGQKCSLYAQKIFEEVVEDLSKKLNLVQPILFLIIALIIMAMYLVLMLPMLTMEI